MKVRKTLRKFLDVTGRHKQYFLRGHNSWFYFAFWLVNFTVIIYKLLLEDVVLPEWLRFSYFFVLFILIYIPLAIFVGRFDFKRGTFRGEVNLIRKVNPIWVQQFENQETIILEQKELRKELAKIKELLKIQIDIKDGGKKL